MVNSVIHALKADNGPAKVGLYAGTDLKQFPKHLAIIKNHNIRLRLSLMLAVRTDAMGLLSMAKKIH